jgi:hypothetical protein
MMWDVQQCTHGLEWADNLDKSEWTASQVALFLSYLPFTEQIWQRASSWLGHAEKEYWHIVHAYCYPPDSDIGIAIDKLIEYGRPHVAINCLQGMLYKKFG